MFVDPPANIEGLTEAQFQTLVTEAAQLNGWMVVHIREMFGNPKGLPDLIMWRRAGRLAAEVADGLLIELKKKGGKISPGQQRWIDHAAAHGVPVHVIYPSDWNHLMEILS